MQGGVSGYWADESNLSSPAAAKDDNLRVSFYTGKHWKHVANEDGTPIPNAKPESFDVPFVRIEVPGDSRLIHDRVAWVDDSHPHSDSRRFPRQWAAYQSGKEAEMTGTPLAEWALVLRSQVEALRTKHIYTVEQLAELPDSSTQFLGGLDLREKARKWLAAKVSAAPAKDAEAMRAELEELKAQNAKLLALADSSRPAKEKRAEKQTA